MGVNDGIKSTCRMCLEENMNTKEIQSVFDTNEATGKPMKFSEMLMSFAAIKIILDDGLPHQICPNCALDTIKTYLFIRMCEESDKTLRNPPEIPIDEPELQKETVIEPEIEGDSSAEALKAVMQLSGVQLTPLEPVEIIVFEKNANPPSAVSTEPTTLPQLLPVVEKPQESRTEDEILREKKIAELSKQIKLTEQRLDFKKYKMAIARNRGVGEEEIGVVPKKDETSPQKAAIIEAAKKSRRRQCEICKTFFARSSTLNKHMRVHTGEKPYACELCPKKFANSGGLVVHRRTHTGERPYQCDICKKSFAHTTILTKHLRRHTGERPYECDICHWRFVDNSTMKRHKNTHATQQSYRCQICGLKFTEMNSLISHKRTHTMLGPYECTICNIQYRQVSSLARHRRRVHSELLEEKKLDEFTENANEPKPDAGGDQTVKERSRERVERMKSLHGSKTSSLSSDQRRRKRPNILKKANPYQCDICDKKFALSSVLARHKRMHMRGETDESERRFECLVCKMRFSQASSLLRHQRMHDEKEENSVN